MPPNYWTQFITLSVAVVVTIAAALQAGSPRPWSWRRFLITVALLAAATAIAIAAGHAATKQFGMHATAIAVCCAALGTALLATLARTLRHRQKHHVPNPSKPIPELPRRK